MAAQKTSAVVQRIAGRLLADTPRALTERWRPAARKAKRAFEAMMTMGKIDVAAIEAARGVSQRGDGFGVPAERAALKTKGFGLRPACRSPASGRSQAPSVSNAMAS